jgi:hypothetical protein
MSGERFIRHPDDRDRGSKDPGIRIDRLWAVINVDATGAEGITAIHTPDGGAMPMIVSTKAGAQALWERAKEISRQHGGRPMRLLCFSVREVLDTFPAGGSSEPEGGGR